MFFLRNFRLINFLSLLTTFGFLDIFCLSLVETLDMEILFRALDINPGFAEFLVPEVWKNTLSSCFCRKEIKKSRKNPISKNKRGVTK